MPTFGGAPKCINHLASAKPRIREVRLAPTLPQAPTPSAIHMQPFTGNASIGHKKNVRVRNLGGRVKSLDRQGRHAFDNTILAFAETGQPRRIDHAGRHDIDANRRELWSRSRRRCRREATDADGRHAACPEVKATEPPGGISLTASLSATNGTRIRSSYIPPKNARRCPPRFVIPAHLPCSEDGRSPRQARSRDAMIGVGQIAGNRRYPSVRLLVEVSRNSARLTSGQPRDRTQDGR